MSQRPATPADLDAVLALEQECFPDPWGEQLIAPGLAGELPTVTYLVSEDADGVTGYVVVSIAGDIADLQRLGVTQRVRRTGVAGKLLDLAITTAIMAERRPPDRMLIEVRADNADALAFYAAKDFVEIDRRPRYYSDGSDAVILRRSLGLGCGGRRG
ncbi:MAG TPA: GNAT family N-acetyltransferase [Marmoricola sp.]|nr:GNAT family N-acetyltransferase [Nocardioidaceae bacterium]MCB8993389.1 GNAT family N-acetyltransferase [Nocardioidaceae bacterium]MCO5324807.1 GNAT family N-acetyltransferase [Nocardioidaceae bacterium]HRV69276.1 GNAT family N-acetyltransferase [Marmoricola sp.]